MLRSTFAERGPGFVAINVAGGNVRDGRDLYMSELRVALVYTQVGDDGIALREASGL